MGDDWEAEDFDPEQGFQKASLTDKWEGEDEDDGVKDAWDDEDEEEKEAKDDAEKNGEAAGKAFQVKKKKSKIEETLRKKEEAKKEKMNKLKQQEESSKELTPEEQLTEKLRQEELQKESDLELTKDMFGSEAPLAADSLDALNPQTKEDFDRFARLLKTKLATLESSPFYVDFLEEVVKDCCINLDTDHAKRIGNSITAIANEKAKAEKAAVKTKKKSKKGVLVGSSKAGKRDELDAYDDMEDFI